MEEQWYKCPYCGKKIIPINSNTTIISAELYCRGAGCKKKLYPTVINGVITKRDNK